MFSHSAITREDLQTALQRGVRLPEVERALLEILKAPGPEETAKTPLYILRRLNPDLESFVSHWMQGTYAESVAKTAATRDVSLLPYPSRGINVKTYLTSFIKKLKPSVIAIDVSPATIGAALHYAFSLLYALRIPVRVGLCEGDSCYEEVFFQPGDFLPELAALCFRSRIPIVPLFSRSRLVASQ